MFIVLKQGFYLKDFILSPATVKIRQQLQHLASVVSQNEGLHSLPSGTTKCQKCLKECCVRRKEKKTQQKSRAASNNGTSPFIRSRNKSLLM